jgi:hypothetical protein
MNAMMKRGTKISTAGLAIFAGALVALTITPNQAKSQAIPSANGAYMGVVGSAPYLSQELQFCQQSVSTAAAIGCSGSVPAGARVVYIQPEVAAIRCRGDGTAPTASVGQPVAVGQQLQYAGAPLSNLQCIAQTGTSTVDLWFFK